MPLCSHGSSDTGCVRQHNEDRILCDDRLGLYVVSDGIGGRRHGDVAAQIVTDTIRQNIESSTGEGPGAASKRLLTAVKAANRGVWHRSGESLQFLGMGATVAAVLVEGTAAVAANIGDSRVYFLRNGRLECLSVDDSASMHVPGLDGQPASVRTMLTRSAGSGPDVEVHLKQVELFQGDLLLLCSDGLHGYLTEDRIAALIGSSEPIPARTEALIAATRAAGAPDNVSAVLVQYLP